MTEPVRSNQGRAKKNCRNERAIDQRRDQPSADPWIDAVRLNVRRTIAQILLWSMPIRHLVDTGCLKVVGAVYHVETGEVEFLSPET